MWLRNSMFGLVLFVLGATAALAVALVFPDWLEAAREFLKLESAAAKPEDAKKPGDDEHEHIHLSPAARKSLGLVVGQIRLLDEYVRTIAVPGAIVERPGNCEQCVSAPLSGVIKQIYATPHDRVAPGTPLFLLQVISEPLQTAQASYYKTKRELEQAHDRQKRMNTSVVSPATVLELQQQAERLATGLEGLHQDLKVLGLTGEQINRVAEGVFLNEITIVAPNPVPNHGAEHLDKSDSKHVHTENFFFEMEELKTVVGDTVKSGQVLCLLADHKTLFIEGRAFAVEAALVQKAAKEALTVQAEVMGESAKMVEKLQLSFFANKVDPETQTLTFYVVLPNSFEELKNGSKTYQLWQYRPGQRVILHVPTQKLKKVFVVPAAAVVREGPESFVFRPHGPDFERHAVHILHEDSREVVLAYDEDLVDQLVAMNGAIQLNWVLKSQRAGGGGGGHSHGG